MEIIFHYTNLNCVEQIVKDACLKISKADKMFGIKPAIWFSKNKRWEPTATKMAFNGTEIVELTEEEQLNAFGMIRFGIPFTTELISWRKYRHVGKINPLLHTSLERVGKEKGANPDDWYCSLKNIPLSTCVCIEQFDGTEWVNVIAEEVDEQNPSVLNP